MYVISNNTMEYQQVSKAHQWELLQENDGIINDENMAPTNSINSKYDEEVAEIERIQKFSPGLPLLIVVSDCENTDGNDDDDEYSVITTITGFGDFCSSVDGSSNTAAGGTTLASLDAAFYDDLLSEATSITSYSLGSYPLNDMMTIAKDMDGHPCKDTIPMMPRRQRSRGTLRSLSSSSSMGSNKRAKQRRQNSALRREKRHAAILLKKKQQERMAALKSGCVLTSTPPPAVKKALSSVTCKTAITEAMTLSTTSSNLISDTSLLSPSNDSAVTVLPPPRQRRRARASSEYNFNPKSAATTSIAATTSSVVSSRPSDIAGSTNTAATSPFRKSKSMEAGENQNDIVNYNIDNSKLRFQKILNQFQQQQQQQQHQGTTQPQNNIVRKCKSVDGSTSHYATMWTVKEGR